MPDVQTGRPRSFRAHGEPCSARSSEQGLSVRTQQSFQRPILAYILSPSYSGSTLLTFLLGAHPNVATVGELKTTAMGDVDQYVCSCGTKIRRCPFWQKVTRELGRRGVPFEVGEFGTHFRFESGSLANRLLGARFRGPAFEKLRDVGLQLMPAHRREFRAILEKNRALVEIISTIQQGTVFLDSSKDPLRLKYLLASGYWDFKVIHLIRDGRATASSYMKHHRVAMEVAAREWRRTHEECRRMLSKVPTDAQLTVHHEDLCRDPHALLDSIFGFLGIDAGAAVHDFRSIEHHIVGNYMRLGASSEIKLDEKWRTTTTSPDLEVFDRIAGEANRRFGYE